jgi:Transposase IS66 family
LYGLPRFVLASKVVGTDDTPVKVLDRKPPQARKGRIRPYVGARDHLAAVYDYTATRERAGPEEFLKVIAVIYKPTLMPPTTPSLLSQSAEW